MKMLQISTDLKLPVDAVTQTLVIYGGKGMGKTNLISVLMEELDRAKQRFSAIDPMGVMWGLRYSADGKGNGIEILILGGKHGDIPIEPTGGGVVADLVADEDVNVVIDISRHPNGKMWSKGERIRFVADYFIRLYERQGEHCRPICQILDEAGRYCPQIIPHGSPDLSRCVGAIEACVEEGRNVGIGVCLVTQRSARMNKSVSELADCMIAFRTIGPNSVEAILDWLGEHVEKSRWKELIGQLRSLPRGTALVVSPGWLNFEGIAAMRARQTFDSSVTPKAGQERKTYGQGAKPNLSPYLDRMKETIEKAKQDNPAELKKQIRDLETKLKVSINSRASADAIRRTLNEGPDNQVIMKAIKAAEAPLLRQITSLTEKAKRAGQRLGEVSSMLSEIAGTPVISKSEELSKSFGEAIDAGAKKMNASQLVKSEQSFHRIASNLPRTVSSSVGDVKVSKAERCILTALAQTGAASKSKIAVLAGYALGGGGFENAISHLRVQGWITASEPIEITDGGHDGLAQSGGFQTLPTGRALMDYWKSKLGHAEREILRVLDENHVQLSKEDIAANTLSVKGEPYAPEGGGFSNALSKLRTLELVVGSKQISLCDELLAARRAA